MKKVLFITMLFLAAATLSARAQMPRLPDPSQHQMIRNAEASRMKTYNDKSKPHLKAPNLKRLNRQTYGRSEEEMRRCEVSNGLMVRNNMNYSYAREALVKAELAIEKAERNLFALIEKQRFERAELQERIDLAASEGRDCSKLMGKMEKLEKKHAKQLHKAQERVDKAKAKYNQALRRTERI